MTIGAIAIEDERTITILHEALLVDNGDGDLRGEMSREEGAIRGIESRRTRRVQS